MRYVCWTRLDLDRSGWKFRESPLKFLHQFSSPGLSFRLVPWEQFESFAFMYIYVFYRLRIETFCLQVVMGGGRTKFFDRFTQDPAEPGPDTGGDRRDGRNLIEVNANVVV